MSDYKMKNPHEILEVEKNADARTIRKAYMTLALQHHPDRNFGNEAEAEAKFKEISTAYKTLSDPEHGMNTKMEQSREPSTEDNEKSIVPLDKSIVPFKLDDVDKSIVPFNPEGPLPYDDSIEEIKQPLSLEPLYKPAREGEKLDCYKILGVDQNAAPSLIELTFIELLELLMGKRQFNVATESYYFSNPEDMIAYNRLVNAYEIMMVPSYRNIHDEHLGIHPAVDREEFSQEQSDLNEEIKAEAHEELQEQMPLLLMSAMPDTNVVPEVNIPLQLTEKGEPDANKFNMDSLRTEREKVAIRSEQSSEEPQSYHRAFQP